MASSKFLIEVLSKIEEKNLPVRLQRQFIVCDDNNKNSGQIVRIMQWNMLAQALCHGSDNFVLCPKEALAWENRQWRVLEEILQYSPDIICLEEVDKFQFVQENLQKEGYRGFFFPKPESPCLDFDHHSGPDGCAMFYNANKFKLLNQESIILKDGKSLTNQVSVIGTFAFVNSINSDIPAFTVAGTHLKAKTPFSRLRFSQGSYLLDYIEKKVGSGPVVICGDFNADPDEPIYKAFKESALELSSSYTFISPTKSEPAYTTWKIRGGDGGNVESCKTIDYMWHSKHFQPKSILDIPKEKDLGENKLPSFSFPSDHLSLVCDLQLTS